MKRILILSANPQNTTRLRVDEEMREIKEGLRRSRLREEFVIETSHGVRYRDIRRAILDFEPNIVHFSGHGEGEEGLVFEDETGQVKLVETEALAGLFELFADRIECVVLNACYSEVQAKAIAQHIPYVVGMNKAIGDKAAIEFAVGFYDGLGAGRSVEFAYKLGCNSIEVAGITEHLTPQLLPNANVLTNRVSSQAEVNLDGEQSTKSKQKETSIEEFNLELKEREMPSIFICYSHKDEEWRDKLLEFLKSLNLEQQTVWSDIDLKPGDIWDEKIKEVLPKVTVAVILVSQPLLNSTYVCNEELPRLLKRCEEEGVRIVPLFVKYADVENVPFNYINQQGQEQKFYLNQFQSPPNNSPAQPLYTLSEPEQDRVLLSVARSLRSLIEEDKKKKIEQNEVLSTLTTVNKPSLPDFVKNSSLDLDNSFVYLLIKLNPESSKINKNESEKFLLDGWLAIPESPTSYQHKQLLETFKSNRSYTQAEIEQNFSNLITECNQKVDELKPNQYFKIAIEWILPDNLLSSPIDCWQYRKNKKIGCSRRFYSVHIRSSQRLHIKYRDCVPLWQDKWDFLWSHFQQINLSNYILACQCNSNSEEDLESLCCDDDKMIIGINFPSDLQKLENITYEFIIETGIPLALWSRCKACKVNHIRDLDTLINPSDSQVLNLKKLPISVKNMRLSAKKNQPLHLGHHLCFLWENPYNYPIKRKLKFN